jgi:predicted ATPase
MRSPSTRSGSRLVARICSPGAALAVAEALIRAYEHGVWLIDLAPLGDSGLVPSII